jgi:hypothetical protein
MRGVRWLVGLGALAVALAALYLLVVQSETPDRSNPNESAMDEIDAESREAMRNLLREAGKD